jgi:hypothetical protein
MGRAKSRQYCVIGGGSLQMVSEPLPSLRWWERAQAYKGRRRALAGMPRMGWSHEGRQRGRWVQRGSDCDVPHRLGMRMWCVLKPWWQWTYQNSAVKWAAARANLGWVTSWEVWYGESQKRTVLCHWGWVVTKQVKSMHKGRLDDK